MMTDPACILARSRTIAVVGASGTPGKAAWTVPRALLAAGWDVVPVNPRYGELFGRRCWPDLTTAAKAGHIDLVDVFRPPSDAPGVATEAVEVGAGGLWLQLGIRSLDARRIAVAGGLDYVEDACTAVVCRTLGGTRLGGTAAGR